MAEEIDDVSCPSHYNRAGFKCDDIINGLLDEAGFDVAGPVSFWWGLAFKYMFRWFFKGTTPQERLRDLKKAEECIKRTREAYEDKIKRDEIYYG